MSAQFEPKLLGAPTSVHVELRIDPPQALLPPPLVGIDISYPGNLGIATTGLGMASCSPASLEANGAGGCPANSKMGAGSAVVGVTFGPDAVEERVRLGLFAGPSTDGYLHLLIVAEGKEPVQARIVMTGVLLPGHLKISVPPTPGLPGAPDVSMLEVRVTLGGALTYYERRKGRLVAYRPRGIGLPSSCPRGGWRLGAALAFEGGAQSRAHHVIGCPPHA